MVKSYIAKLIKEIRQDNLLSQEKVGQLLGFSKDAISNYERGVRSLSLDTLMAYSKKFKVQIVVDNGEIYYKKRECDKTMESKTMPVEALIIDNNVLAENTRKVDEILQGNDYAQFHLTASFLEEYNQKEDIQQLVHALSANNEEITKSRFDDLFATRLAPKYLLLRHPDTNHWCLDSRVTMDQTCDLVRELGYKIDGDNLGWDIYSLYQKQRTAAGAVCITYEDLRRHVKSYYSYVTMLNKIIGEHSDTNTRLQQVKDGYFEQVAYWQKASTDTTPSLAYDELYGSVMAYARHLKNLGVAMKIVYNDCDRYLGTFISDTPLSWRDLPIHFDSYKLHERLFGGEQKVRQPEEMARVILADIATYATDGILPSYMRIEGKNDIAGLLLKIYEPQYS